MPPRPGALALVLALLVAPAARAEGLAPVGRPVAEAAPLVGAIEVDGALDEAAWAAAAPASGFSQRSPDEQAAATFATEFRVLRGERSLYVGVRAHDPAPATIVRQIGRRDSAIRTDWILVGIDSYHDRRTAYVFGLNPAGVQRDSIVYDDTTEDASWDAVWEGAARVDAGGWTAELRIPYSQLRYSGDADQRWGLQVVREIARLGEADAWAPSPASLPQLVSRFGELGGVSAIPASRRIEILPYAIGGGSFYRAAPGDPLHDGHDAVLGGGLDFKLGLGPSVTVAGTVNPDFGQVEADPSQVNLGAGELFLTEKRPFFLEGTEIFRFGIASGDGGQEQLFYSRRIGAAPHGDAAEVGDHVEQPDVTTIYGATKLSGKSASGWSFGLLEAVTGTERARFALADGTPPRTMVVEPLTNFAIARLRRDLRAGRTSLGGALTAVNRRLDGTGLAASLHDQAYAGGLEVSHRFADDGYQTTARLSGSWVHGSREAIDATQTSSVHYFQRPDAAHLERDPTRTHLGGAAAQASLSKIAGSLRWATEVETRSPGFEVNDLGFQQSSDYLVHSLWLEQRDDRPGRHLRSRRASYAFWHVWSTGGELATVAGNALGALELSSQWGVAAGGGATLDRLDRDGLRGGPGLRHDPILDAWCDLYSDSRRALSGTVAVAAYQVPATGAAGVRVSPALTLRVASNAEVTLAPSVRVASDDTQYVDQVVDTAGETRYLLARLHQTTTSLTLRASLALSPRLSLQLYAQPYVTTGRYDAYKEAIRPGARRRADRYRVFADGDVERRPGDELAIDRDGDGVADLRFARPDFSFRQLRSNLVARWEYRPGSALFVIWSHDRTAEALDGRYRLGAELAALRDEPGEHVVMAKLSYWLGL
jgi:hypothetical protein